jgi:hypothetical protein
MAPRHKGKSKAIEVPPHISFSQVEALREAFPGEEQAIQEVLMADSPPTPHPSSTTGQKHSQSDAGLTPNAKHVLPPPTPSQETVALPSLLPPSPPKEEVLPACIQEYFGVSDVEGFKNEIKNYMQMFKNITNIFKSREAFNYVMPGVNAKFYLGRWLLDSLKETIAIFKLINPSPPTDIPAEVITSPEVDMSAPSSEPEKAKPTPPLKKDMKGAPGKPVAAPRLPLPLPSSQQAPAPKDAPPISIAKRMRGKHTTHSPSRRGIHLTLPAGSPITAASFTPAVIDCLNKSISEDLHGDLCFTSAHVAPRGILLQAMCTPTSQEILFMLRHV